MEICTVNVLGHLFVCIREDLVDVVCMLLLATFKKSDLLEYLIVPDICCFHARLETNYS